MKRRKLDFTKDFLKEIAKLPPKHFKQVVSKALALVIEIEPPDSKELEGYDGLWRVDSGEYRIVYAYNDEVVQLIITGKRNDGEVYRLLARRMGG
jgi:mRNA interferase RelE/StbE